MTEQEAISILRIAEEYMRCGNIPIIPIETYGIAIKAIEKQIPKPKHKYMGYRCVCGNEVAKNQDYCEHCGQGLLEWDKE